MKKYVELYLVFCIKYAAAKNIADDFLIYKIQDTKYKIPLLNVHFPPEMTRIFRKKSAAFTLAVLCFLLIGKVTAEPLKPKVSEPITYEDFLYGVDEVRQNVDDVQCGGWLDTEGSVEGGTVQGFVPTPVIPGVPGRDSDPLGDPATGLGARENFEYPDSATGLMTACDVTNEEINPEHLCLMSYDKATPKQCEKLYERLTVDLPLQVANNPFFSSDTSIQCDTVVGVPPLVTTVRHYCFDYTSRCSGQGCRTTEGPLFYCQFPLPVPITRQSSFYRHYYPDIRAPDQAWDSVVECYEQYKEVDPKDTVMGQSSEQCEIVLMASDQSPEWDENPDKQKAEIRPTANEVKEKDPYYREAEFPWVKDGKTNLTILDYAEWKEQQASDVPPRLSDALGNPVEANARASKTTPPFSKTDAFDDTTERDIATYWEAEQRELLKITRDPEVRLVLPARFLHGLSDKDALFQMIREVPSLSTGLVEVTLRSGVEDLGLVLQSLAQSQLFAMEEVRIPILVPAAGDIEMRIADWEQWKAASEAAESEHAASANDIIEKLKSYRDRADKVRILRGAMLSYVDQNLEADRLMREELLTWYKENADLLKQATDQNEARRRVQRIWKRVQNAMLIVDECQLLWCSNQRYSAPVYSLLDSWWGDAPAGSARDFSFAPRDEIGRPLSIGYLGLTQPEDLLFDFSSFSFPGQDSLLIPVLWPISVKLDLPIPPPIGSAAPSADDFPDLPGLPDETVFGSLPPVSVEIPDLPKITLPQGPTAEQFAKVENVLKKLRQKIDGTSPNDSEANSEYETGIPATNAPPLDFSRRDIMQGAICRFSNSVMVKRVDDDRSNPETLVHVENDLRERLSRLFARWMPNRTEDFAGRVLRRVEESAPDYGCEEGILCLLLPEQTQTQAAFRWFAPRQTEDFESLRDLMKELTLPKNDEENPYLHSKTSILRRLFPDQILPDHINLIPEE